MTPLRQRMLDELQRRNYSPATTCGYILAIKQFAEYFGRSPEGLGGEEIRQFELYLLKEKKLAPGTVEGRMSALRFLYKKVLKRRDIAYDDLVFPKTPRKLPTVLSPEEIVRMIEAAPNLMHRTILMVLYGTGIRRTEASQLKVSDFDSERMVIHIHHGKGSRDRDVPMTPKLLDNLREYWRWKKPKVFLFPSTEGHRGGEQPISDKTVWYACKEAAARAGISKRIGPHTLRHSFATHLMEAGIDLRTIQLLMGHAHLEHTTLHLHLSQRHLHAAANPTRSDQRCEPQRFTKATGELQGVKRPPWEVADVISKAGTRFIERYGASLTWAQVKVLNAIARCRTAALGGHRDQCDHCGYQAISYNSCRNRHCPKCQTNAREKWLRARERELLPVSYFHLVFSVPHALVPLMWQNKKALFTLLFDASAATLLEIAADPRRLGAETGCLSILHTWGQTLQAHPHIHCVVPGGGLAPDLTRWVSSRPHFFLPVKVLSRVFRGKFIAGLKQAFRRKKLTFHGACLPLSKEKAFADFLRTLFRQDWVVYSKPPFGGAEHVLQYLARYTHRVAISNHRIVDVSDTHVAFRWKDYAHHSKRRIMSLTHEEFLRRFLNHVLPKGFPRIRYFGVLANRRRGELLPLCRTLLCRSVPDRGPAAADLTSSGEGTVWPCPQCQGPMHVLERLTALQISFEESRHVYVVDSS